jgi:hypothetical protein
MKYILLLLLFTFANNCYAQEWIPYQPVVVQSIIQQPIIQYVPQPTVVYQWTPYVVQQNTIVQKMCLFHKTYTVISQPTIQYFYQPVIVYR